MATIPTQNAVPSEAPRDLKFNSGKIDEFVTSLEHEYKDRFGRCHMTIEGMRWIFEQLMERFKVDINQAIIAAGYTPMDSFQQGSEITKRNEILRDETTGEYYRWDGDLPKSVPAGSTPESAGGVGMGVWVSIGDASLRTELKKNNGLSIIGSYNKASDIVDENIGVGSFIHIKEVANGEGAGVFKVVSANGMQTDGGNVFEMSGGKVAVRVGNHNDPSNFGVSSTILCDDQFSAYIDYCNANNENVAVGNYKISNVYFIDTKKNDKKIITKRVTTGGNMLTSLSVMNNMPWNNNKRAFKRYEFSIDENEVPEYGLQGLAFRGDNFYISVDDGTGACKLYKLDRKGNVDNDYGKVLLPLEHGNNLAFSNDGKLYACSGSGSYNAKLFEISEDGKSIINTIDFSRYGVGATFAFDELGNIILSASWVVNVIRFSDLKLLTSFPIPDEVSYNRAGNPQGMIAYDGVIYFGSDKVICAMTYSGEVIESIDVTTRSGENEGITMMRDGFTTCIAQAQLNPKMITSLRPSDSLGNYKGVNMASAVTFSNNSQINPVGMELIDITITSGKITNFSGGSLFKDPVIKTHTDGERIIEAEMKIPLFLMSPSVHCSIYTDVGADRVMGLIRQSSGKQYLMIKVIKDGVVVEPSSITILGIYCTIIGAMGYL